MLISKSSVEMKKKLYSMECIKKKKKQKKEPPPSKKKKDIECEYFQRESLIYRK